MRVLTGVRLWRVREAGLEGEPETHGRRGFVRRAAMPDLGPGPPNGRKPRRRARVSRQGRAKTAPAVRNVKGAGEGVNRTIRRSGEPSPEANGRACSFGKLWRQALRCSMDGFFEGCERFEDRWVRMPTRVTAAEEGNPKLWGHCKVLQVSGKQRETKRISSGSAATCASFSRAEPSRR